MKWLDVVTTGIPRLTTERCICSWISCCADRRDYKLRWLFHLDCWQPLSRWFDANLAMANCLTGIFDESHVYSSTDNLGYGRVVKKMLDLCENDVLWIEDDKFWTQGWSIRSVANATCMKAWSRKPAPKGGVTNWRTSPAFFPVRYWRWVRDNYPDYPEKVGELSLIALTRLLDAGEVIASKAGFWCDIGKKAMTKLGPRYHRGPHMRYEVCNPDAIFRGPRHAAELCLAPENPLRPQVLALCGKR